LGELVNAMIADCTAVDVVHIGNIGAQAPSPPAGTRIFHLPDPSAGGSTRSFNVRVSEAEGAPSSTLLLFVTAGFLQSWDRLEEALNRFLESHKHVVLVFITDRFRALEFATHTYMLTVLATALPGRKFAAALYVYNDSRQARSPHPRLFARVRAVAESARAA